MFNRIQKLLSSEYRNFYEHVLVESPFAQLSKHMRGIRAVQIALTENSLIIASDKFLHEGLVLTCGYSDVEIETLELLQIIPLELLRIKLTRKGLHDRFYMKIICKENPERVWKAFEFGGHVSKHFFWDVWNFNIEEMREKEELFVNSSVDELKITELFSSANFNSNQSTTEENLSVQKENSLSSLRESLKNPVIDDKLLQFSSKTKSFHEQNEKSFRETKI